MQRSFPSFLTRSGAVQCREQGRMTALGFGVEGVVETDLTDGQTGGRMEDTGMKAARGRRPRNARSTKIRRSMFKGTRHYRMVGDNMFGLLWASKTMLKWGG